jgi:hypothetical protein
MGSGPMLLTKILAAQLTRCGIVFLLKGAMFAA